MDSSKANLLPARRLRLGPFLFVGVVVIGVAAAGFFVWQNRHRNAVRERALSLAGQNRFDEAGPLLVQVLQWWPDDVKVARAVAIGKLRSNELHATDAVHFTRWCRLAPDNPTAYEKRMEFWFRQKKLKMALEDGLKVVELKRDRFNSSMNVATIALSVGRYELAEKHCRQCLAAKPNHPQVQYLLALAYYNQGKSAKADATLKRLLARHSSHPLGLLLYGVRLAEQDKPGPAVAALKKALRGTLEENKAQKARYHLSQALAQMGEKREAEKINQQREKVDLARQLELDSLAQPKNLQLHLQAARILLELDELERCAVVLQRIQNSYPNDSETRMMHDRVRQRARELKRGTK